MPDPPWVTPRADPTEVSGRAFDALPPDWLFRWVDPDHPLRGGTFGWDSVFRGFAFKGLPGSDDVEVYFVNPDHPEVQLNVYASDDSIHLSFVGSEFTRPTELVLNGNGFQISNSDFTIYSGGDRGIILYSPDSTPHRLKVANDGTLSTEPVV